MDVSEMVKGCAGFRTSKPGVSIAPFLRCVNCSLADSDIKCAELRRRTQCRIIDAYNPTMWNWSVTETEV